MKVPDSLIALSSIRPGGRVVLCGDDRQLAPVVRGSYDAEETLFGSAFAHFAARFGRLPLRESRRMNDALVDYPRRTFYPGLVSMVPARRVAVSADGVDLSDPVDALLWDALLRPEDSVVFCHLRGLHVDGAQPFERGCGAAGDAARAGLRDGAGSPFTADASAAALAILSPHARRQRPRLVTALGWAYGELRWWTRWSDACERVR